MPGRPPPSPEPAPAFHPGRCRQGRPGWPWLMPSSPGLGVWEPLRSDRGPSPSGELRLGHPGTRLGGRRPGTLAGLGPTSALCTDLGGQRAGGQEYGGSGTTASPEGRGRRERARRPACDPRPGHHWRREPRPPPGRARGGRGPAPAARTDRQQPRPGSPSAGRLPPGSPRPERRRPGPSGADDEARPRPGRPRERGPVPVPARLLRRLDGARAAIGAALWPARLPWRRAFVWPRRGRSAREQRPRPRRGRGRGGTGKGGLAGRGRERGRGGGGPPGGAHPARPRASYMAPCAPDAQRLQWVDSAWRLGGLA